MKFFISDSILKLYTWKGTAEKPPFNGFTHIWKTLYASVKINHSKYNEKRFEKYMSEYVKHAKSRESRKNAKGCDKKRKYDQEEEEENYGTEDDDESEDYDEDDE